MVAEIIITGGFAAECHKVPRALVGAFFYDQLDKK